VRYKADITILLAGHDQSEKSSFIKLLKSLSQGKGPFDLETYDSTIPPTGRNSSASSNLAEAHIIPSSNECPIKIINFPPFTGSSGIIQAHEAQACLKHAISNSVLSLDALIILIDGTLERPNPEVEYMLEALAIILPRSILDNTAFVFTNCEPLTQRLKIDNLPSVWSRPFNCTLDNPITCLESYRSLGLGLSGRQKTRQEQKIEDRYNEAISTIHELFSWVDEWATHSTTEILQLACLSGDLEAHFESLLSESVNFSRQRKALLDLRVSRSEITKELVSLLMWYRNE
jgi:hypothetical protein